jgi:hypothetical protein
VSRLLAQKNIHMARCARCGDDLSVRITEPRKRVGVTYGKSDGKVYCTNEQCSNHIAPVRLGKSPHPGPQPA